MRNLVIGSVVAALGFGITLFLVRKNEPAPVAESVTAPPAGAVGEIRPLNEVMIRAPTAPPASPASRPPAPPPAGADASVPLPLGPEFDLLFESNPVMRTMHAALERERRDEPWATQMEGKWHAAFSANPELLAIGTPNVHCRMTRCEIQLVSIKPVQLDRMGWMQLISRGAGQRAPGDTSPVLARRVVNGVLGSVENDGSTVIIYSYEYERESP